MHFYDFLRSAAVMQCNNMLMVGYAMHNLQTDCTRSFISTTSNIAGKLIVKTSKRRTLFFAIEMLIRYGFKGKLTQRITQ
ncbi:CLUMA_CG010128, isoform A [Clunio marinus]|uniref:CLUMA_CG010128, isoform A n=1 Tax=Clunio marinus TaxID=568069 RepID=A0A1J1I8V6_9DIPT|nr:CLUMA_CG010128, isoform A [Clunio marinus]